MLPKFPSESDLEQIHKCECHGEQVDEKGIGRDGQHLTTCPSHRTYNETFANEWRADRARWSAGVRGASFGFATAVFGG